MYIHLSPLYPGAESDRSAQQRHSGKRLVVTWPSLNVVVPESDVL